MIPYTSNCELHTLVQNAIFELEGQIDKSWDRLMVLEGKITKSQKFKSILQDKDGDGEMGWTAQMEEQLVSDMFSAAESHANHAIWSEDLRHFQGQLDTISTTRET